MATPAQWDIVIYSGSKYDVTLTVRNAAGAAQSLVGYSAKMQIRTTPETTGTPIMEALHSGADPNARLVLGGSAGTVQIIIPATVSSSWTFTNAYYSLELLPAGDADEAEWLVYGTVRRIADTTY